ncbi:hypothetical protein, partial [Flaviramulus basaltis]|uniref:hypothetical protein n=1 Tax=Flaviramulus basaltis TaxID=369401 RepID=UPI001C0AFB94
YSGNLFSVFIVKCAHNYIFFNVWSAFINEWQRLRIRIVRFCMRGFSEGKSEASKTARTLD